MLEGTIVKLDRGWPLVETADGTLIRCEHATSLVKGEKVRAVIGDRVEIDIPEGHDCGIVCNIDERRTQLVRKDPTERTQSQVLAANFDLIILAEPLAELNCKRLERALVLAHETLAQVAVVLTKADLAQDDVADASARQAQAIAGPSVPVLTLSADDADSVERVRALIPAGTVAVLVGKSGVGKSSLVNLLAGSNVREVGDVREADGKGRHTTVSRAMVDIVGGGRVVDMPGIRGLGLWDAETGLEIAFQDVAELASHCRFRDCKHGEEPGCAVRQAVADGTLAQERFASYQALRAEAEKMRQRRDEARQMRGEKASDRRKPSKKKHH